jgi:hypothetical protein
MLRIVTATALSLATIACLVVVAFLWAVFGKSGGGDPVAGGLLLLMLAFIGGMWFAFSRRWHILAWLLAAAPVALIALFLATFKLPMF